MNLLRALITGGALLAICPQGIADPAPVIRYAPVENLEHIDVALIDTGKHEIELAAYVLTNWPIIRALTRATDRGVKVRIYLDGAQLAEDEHAALFRDLAETPVTASAQRKAWTQAEAHRSPEARSDQAARRQEPGTTGAVGA